jgi:hypothetical protein
MKRPFERAAQLASLKALEFEVLVVGGGATGLGIAVDAASRGYRTALIEAHDFAKATSSRSTKLVHGGVRYLAEMHFSLVTEALEERAILCENAPHLVHDLAFILGQHVDRALKSRPIVERRRPGHIVDGRQRGVLVGRHVALRPELTASVCRAFVQHRPLVPWKVWYTGSQFRYEKPQRGRYRQFDQVGIEVLGADDPHLDVEIIALGWEFCESVLPREVSRVLAACKGTAVLALRRDVKDALLQQLPDLRERILGVMATHE